ncbi:MAG TPA: glycosyltransferase [Thermoanaerobaculia bacterium]|jgi:glycosyltransferase involved in cell wall biosynthesis
MIFPLACTIVANNYLAYARAFTRSFLERHPQGKVCVLIVDRPQPGHRYEDEPFAVTFADQLGIPGFPHFAFRYSILELNTAVKPYFLLHLHRTLGCDRACYFDPDILVLGDLAELYERLGNVDAVLTPHLTAPLEDDRVPSEREILLSGLYNLGFLGISFNERTLPFLDWWSRRLYRDCLHDVARGLFVDQRWMDFAPSFLPRVEILRDPGYNAAYWNLAHRTISGREGEWSVNGAPLRFFHFSGYDFRRPELISKFQNRFTFSDRPDVLPLFRLYDESIQREGQGEVQEFPYQYGLFDNGVPVPEVARRALRQVDPQGKRWADPFVTAGPDSFFEWLRQPADEAGSIPLPRLALLLWDHREDLQRFFSHPWGEDRLRFAHWFVGSTSAPEHIHPAFVEDLRKSLQRTEDQPAEQEQRERTMTGLACLLDPQSSERRAELTRQEIGWLTADAGLEPRRRPRVPRLAMEMHRRRADLLRAFPDPLGADREAMALWYSTSGRQEYQLPEPVVLPVLRSLPWRKQAWARLWWERQSRRQRRAAPPAVSAPVAATPRPHLAAGEVRPAARVVPRCKCPEGFNVIGWSTAPTGVGEACRGTLKALERAGIPCALWPLDGRVDGAPGAVAEGAGQGLPYEVSLYHVNADMMEAVHQRLPRALTSGHHRIGYWFWELSHFPLVFAEAFRHVDEVWAPSRFCQEAYQPLSPVEVRWMPPGIEPTQAAPADREALGIDPEAFLFFFAFDALSVPERKNPAGLLRAFGRVARECRKPIHLLVKINHAESEPAYVAQLQTLADLLPVTLMTGTLPRQELNGLTAACDAYVALHRSEGLGLPLIEAMFLGKPVVATGYGGVTDFLDDETGFVVRHKLTALARPQGPYPAGAVWAEPDVEHAAALMLALVKDPRCAVPKVEAALRRVHALYAPEAAGERFRRELARIREAKGARLARPA